MPLRPIHFAKPSAPALTPDAIVEYEQHGKPILGVISSERKGRFVVVNERGQELELSSDRLYLFPGRMPEGGSKEQFLQKLASESNSLAESLTLEEVWELLRETGGEIQHEDILEVLFPNASLTEHIAVRRALLTDQVYFKRRKTGFEARSPEVVEELKRKAEAERERAAEREELIAAILARLAGESRDIPKKIIEIEELAVHAGQAERAKETGELIQEICERGKISLSGKMEEKARELLEKIGHFHPDEDLVIRRMGRTKIFPRNIESAASEAALRLPELLSSRDAFASVPTFSIDAETTRDIDDAISLRRIDGGWEVGIHISDVSALISPDTELDEHAIRRATSVYCPDYQLPMLPPSLSEGALSLVQGEGRAAVSFFVSFNEALEQTNTWMSLTSVSVTRRMSYNETDEILYGNSAGDELSNTMLKLWDIVCRCEERRLQNGALQFNRRELSPRITPEGRILLEDSGEETPARKLVSELMVLANTSAAAYAARNNIPLVFRGQEPPDVNPAEHGLHLPEGPAREYFRRGLLKRSTTTITPARHFGLGVSYYTQATSPIRRYVDLVNQRQLTSHFRSGAAMYSGEALQEVIALVDAGLEEASLVQRTRTRYWLMKYLLQENLSELSATIVRVDGPRPLAELDIIFSLQQFHPAKTAGPERLGEEIRVRVDQIDPKRDILVLREVR